MADIPNVVLSLIDTLIHQSVSFFGWLGSLIFSPEVGGLATIIGTAIIIHQRYYKSPALILDAKPDTHDPIEYPDSVSISGKLSLHNAGHAPAKDVYLSFTLTNWRYDPDASEIANVAETPLMIKEERTFGYLGSEGERHDIYVENAVYEQDTATLYYDHRRFTEDGCYEIEYMVACNGHGPRTGKIYFCINDDTLTIRRKYPTRWWKLRRKLGWRLPKQSRVLDIGDSSSGSG
jgi:hypothetical protein